MNKPQCKPLIAIGLDGADPDVLDTWMREGKLPNLADLRNRSLWYDLENIDKYRAEVPWTTFLTGVGPDKTGYWGRIVYDPETMTVDEYGSHTFDQHPPFYALSSERKVCIFDMPQTRLREDVNGIQLLAWGAHSPRGPSVSLPENLFGEFSDKYGSHPTLNDDHANCYDLTATRQLKQDFLAGIQRRTAIAQDLLSRDEWDLFLMIYSETHSSGHTFWHTDMPHPLINSDQGYMLEVFQAVDDSIGMLLSEFSDRYRSTVFSVHGMIPNVLDTNSMLFLPELLYRLEVDLNGVLACQPVSKDDDEADYYPSHWSKELWSRRNRDATMLPHSPAQQSDAGLSLSWQPANWYQPLWPKMRAFALPSYSDGYIRVNVKDRDSHGLVSSENYQEYLNKLICSLEQLTDSESGHSLVRDVVQTRNNALDSAPGLPDADLIVLWNEMNPGNIIHHPVAGQFGPVPYFRTGGHSNKGFAMIEGEDNYSSTPESTYSALDLTPTLLALVGVSAPDYMEGSVLPFEGVNT